MPANLNQTLSETPPGQSKKGFILSLIFLLIILLLLPVGVYLVSQKTNLLPKAAAPPKVTGETTFSLETSKKIFNTSEDFTVDVLVRSDLTESNLFNAEIIYPKENLEVLSLSTSSATPNIKITNFSKRWINSTVNKDEGKIILTAAVPNPGLKTDPQKKYLLSKITFKAIKSGAISLNFNAPSEIYSNKDNKNILTNKIGLNLNITGPEILNEASSSASTNCQKRPSCLDSPKACKITEPKSGWCPFEKKLELLSQSGGEAYLYSSKIPITWTSQGLNSLSLGLILNDEFLGNIATASAIANRFDWDISKTLAVSLVNPSNSFKISLKSLDGQISTQSAGPFEILNLPSLPNISSTSAILEKNNADITEDGTKDLADLSKLLSNFNNPNIEIKNYDLNKDGFLNDLDLWFFTKLLNL